MHTVPGWITAAGKVWQFVKESMCGVFAHRQAVTYQSQRLEADVLRNRPHEARTAERYAALGHKAHMIEDHQYYDKDKKLWQTEKTVDTVDGVEFKTLLEGKGFNTIDHALQDASHKKGLRLVVMDNTESLYLQDDEVVGYIERSLKGRRVNEVLLIRKDGATQTIRKQN